MLMRQQKSKDIARGIFSHILSHSEKAHFLSKLSPERESHLSEVISKTIENLLGSEPLKREDILAMGENHYRLGVSIEWIRESLGWALSEYLRSLSDQGESVRISGRFLEHLSIQCQGMMRAEEGSFVNVPTRRGSCTRCGSAERF